MYICTIDAFNTDNEKRDHEYEKEEAQWKVLEGAKGIEETV